MFPRFYEQLVVPWMLALEGGRLAAILENDAHQQTVLDVAEDHVGIRPLDAQPEGGRLQHNSDESPSTFTDELSGGVLKF